MTKDEEYTIHLEVHWPMASSGVNLSAKTFAGAHRLSRAYLMSVTEPLMVTANIVGRHKRVLSGSREHVMDQLASVPN